MRRRLLAAGLLLLAIGGCQMGPRDRRFVVFFKPGSVELDEAARGVAAGAAAVALQRPEQPVTIAAFADPEGTPAANAELIRARGQAVFDALVRAGLPPTRIARREVGQVDYQLDAQESRRAVVTVGGR
jgi:outer membrane protein OmpA-like peptidoglycan-associated protein